MVSSVFLFFQDLLLFVKAPNGQVSLGSFLFVPQAWTLGVELLFYICAPSLNRLRTRYLIIIICLSLLIRIIVYANGYNTDPWTYRFFPFELAFFLSGMIMSRIYLEKKVLIENIKKPYLVLIAAFCIILVLIFQFISIDFEVKKWLLFIVVTALLPFLFALSNKFKFDRIVGELSYPVYIVHMMVGAFVIPVLSKFIVLQDNLRSFVFVILTVIVAIVLSNIVEKIVQRVRTFHNHS
jgi:peptidoglycan/LPS O-acetylase OafA/YrhL